MKFDNIKFQIHNIILLFLVILFRIHHTTNKEKKKYNPFYSNTSTKINGNIYDLVPLNVECPKNSALVSFQ